MLSRAAPCSTLSGPVWTTEPSPAPSSKKRETSSEPSSEVPSFRWVASSRMPGFWRPSLVRYWLETDTTAVEEGPVLRTTSATSTLPCMSIPGAPPRIRSILATWLAGMRRRTLSRSSFLLVGSSPSISTSPAAPSKPRTLEPSSKTKPGSRSIMSRAVLGWAAAKKLAG